MIVSAINNFRQNLRDAVTREGITQLELARRSKLHFVTISRILTGQTSLTIEIADRLASAIGVPLALLLSEPPKARPKREKAVSS